MQTAETFDLLDYMAGVDSRLLGSADGRRALTRLDPLLFALLYLPHHLKGAETGGVITFSDAHLDWCEQALRWVVPPTGPMQQRHAYVAPRSMGKSTWWFLILPLWAAAHGHVRFVAAFANMATQAEEHLSTFKRETDTNVVLREDYPDLCRPARRVSGVQMADRVGMLQTRSGFVFAARGIDSGNLGMKVGELRPDVLILDDIEPGESNYSGGQVVKRLSTLQDVIFPLNVNARVVIVGTVTMPGSIVHQLVRSVRRGADDLADYVQPEWITDENIQTHHYPAIVTREDGSERSIWPGRWSLAFLQSIRHTRSYRKNYDNDPAGNDGGYWTDSDFRYGDVPAITRRVLSVDPAVTSKTSSDPTGIAVVAYSPSTGRCVVELVEEVRLTGRALRQRIVDILQAVPNIGGVLVETNQGGDLWLDVFHDLPVSVKTVHQTVKKEIRAAEVLTHYQGGRVFHARRFHALEDQMMAFPNAPHDDQLDAVGSAVLRFLAPPVRKVARSRSMSYS